MDEIESIFNKMYALGIWKQACGCSWVVKPFGIAVPYFCIPEMGDGTRISIALRICEGWRTFNELMLYRMDANIGYITSEDELSQFYLTRLANGQVVAARADPGYALIKLTAAQQQLVVRILWEAYGVLLRLEGDPDLTKKYSDSRSIFARVEFEPGKWRDEPLEVPPSMPYTESVSIRKDVINQLKDLPFVREEAIDFDFLRDLYRQVNEPHPRSLYRMIAADSKTAKPVIDLRVAIDREMGLHELWETMPNRLVQVLLSLRHVPGEIRVRSSRVFRLIKIICIEIPVKISLHDKLPALEAAFHV